ncbi:MAG: OmpA family protein [Verrucomicrobiales bacterium]|nr:OmpA family protein [Verrucomicrobiales bacterium]
MAFTSYSWEQSISRSFPAAAPASAWSLRWWILLAVLTSSAIHIGLFALFGDLRLEGVGDFSEEALSQQNDSRFEDQIRLDPKLLEQTLSVPIPEVQPQTADNTVTTELPPIDQIAPMLDGEVVISPETRTPLNIQFSAPAQGDVGSAVDAVSAVDSAIAGGIEKRIRTASASDVLKTAQVQDDQVTIKVVEKPLTTNDTMKGDLAAARRKGDEGLRGIGFSTLDDLMNIRTPQTGDLKAMMPSDLLFEYNSADVRESAKFDLMKLGFLIQTWTKSQVIVEGHTDTTGEDAYNVELSLRRAQAVADWVVNSLKIDGSRIQVKGLGESQPLVNANGSIEEQALNRRVVIRFLNP